MIKIIMLCTIANNFDVCLLYALLSVVTDNHPIWLRKTIKISDSDADSVLTEDCNLISNRKYEDYIYGNR